MKKAIAWAWVSIVIAVLLGVLVWIGWSVVASIPPALWIIVGSSILGFILIKFTAWCLNVITEDK